MTPTLLDIKQMMLDKVPRKEISALTGYSLGELGLLAMAWDIPPYGKAGRPRRGAAGPEPET